MYILKKPWKLERGQTGMEKKANQNKKPPKTHKEQNQMTDIRPNAK